MLHTVSQACSPRPKVLPVAPAREWDKMAEITHWCHFLASLPRGLVCPLPSWALTPYPDTIFRYPQRKGFPPLPLGLFEFSGHHEWKSPPPQKGQMVWFREHQRRTMEKFETCVTYLMCPYLTRIPVPCQTQSSMHPQISFLHLWGTRKADVSSLYSVQVLLRDEWENADEFCCPRLKEVTQRQS